MCASGMDRHTRMHSRIDGHCDLFPVPPDEVIPIGCNPYRWPDPCPELIEELRPFIELLKSRAVDIYVSAELQPTWLGWLLASVLRPGLALCCTSVEAPERFVAGLQAAFGLEPWPLRQIAPLEEIHEQGRYELLLQALDVPARSFFPGTARNACARAITWSVFRPARRGQKSNGGRWRTSPRRWAPFRRGGSYP